MEGHSQRLLELQAEIKRLLGAEVNNDARHLAEMGRRDELHISETDRRDELHISETDRRDELHQHELEMIRAALETRDLIGQAKGIIMAAFGCSADEAFALIRKRSQHENRKLIEIAAEIVQRTAKGSRPTA